MMRTPTRADIHAAELKFNQSQQHTRACLVRAQVSARKGLARATTLVVVAGIVGLSVIWLLSRRPKAVAATSGAQMVGTTSAVGLGLAFLLRYGKYFTPFIMHQIRLAQIRAADSRRARMLEHTPVDYAATDYRH
jgi:hypothetical protein